MATLVLALVAGGAGTAQASETFDLDTYAASGDSTTPPVQSTRPLVSGQPYVLTIRGTASIWDDAQWAVPGRCGAPEDAPLLNSSGPNASPGALDAETVFGAPNGERFGGRFTCSTETIPFPFAKFSAGGLRVDLGDGFSRLVAEGGPYSVPRDSHTYAYRVTGQGGPVAARFEDERLSDNDGVFRIVVRTLAECEAVNCLAEGSSQTREAPTGGVLSNTTLGLPSARRCVSRRSFTIRLRNRRGLRYRSAKVTVAGKAVTVRRRGGRLTAVISLRGKPASKVTVRIVAITSRGQTLKGARSYRTCAKRSSSSKPPRL